MKKKIKTLNEKSNFLAIEDKYSDYENSKIAVLSAPFEATVSYGGGTKNGPKEIIEASHYVELYDEEFNRELCYDVGIATLPPIKLSEKSEKISLNKIYEAVKSAVEDDKFTVILGGEHSLSVSPIKAYSEKYKNLSVLHIDAHSDLRDSYQGSKNSHASVMARVYEFNKNIVQVGIRAQCIEEAKFIKDNNISTFYMRDIRLGGYGDDWKIKALENLSERVYITFDVDGLDPSIIPATGTPEPGGLLWDETINLIKLVGASKKIMGFDLVELAPAKSHPASNFIAAKLAYKIMNCAFM